jgi:aspartyl-tRNA(Asn)/glutamyl-tRNA(Gln) amidotransferase subunit B
VLRELKQAEKEIEESPIRPEQLGQLIKLIDNNTISGKIAKTVFQEMWQSGKDPEAIVKEKGLVQITDTGAIEKIIDEVIAANAQQVTDYRGGRTKLFGFFVGAVMKASKGQANPDLVNKILTEKLKGS